MEAIRRRVKRVGTAIVGGLLLVIGVIAVPYPGPGWLIIFTALAILATEFEWAQRVLDKARGEYDKWQMWLKRQKAIVQLLFLVLTSTVIVGTIWLLNGFGVMVDLLHFDVPWAHSPLGIFT